MTDEATDPTTASIAEVAPVAEEATPVVRDRETGAPLEPTEPLIPVEETVTPVVEAPVVEPVVAEPVAEPVAPVVEPEPASAPAETEAQKIEADVTNWEPVKTAIAYLKQKIVEVEAWVNQEALKD